MSRKIVLTYALVLFTGCSSWRAKNRVIAPENHEAAPAAGATPESAPAAAEAAPASPAHEDVAIQLKKSDGTEVPVKDSAAPAVEAKAPTSPKADAMTSGPVPAEKAMTWLKHGNQRFLKGYLRRDGAAHKDVVRVASNQHPHSIILAGSDSRVPPEIVFDQKLGEVVVVRTLGPNLDHAVMASIEEAVLRWGPHLLVILGHTGSETIKQAVATMASGDAGSSSLNVINAAMHLRLASLGSKPVSKDYRAEAWANIDGISAELTQHSQVLSEAVARGALEIHPAMYDTAKGSVDFK